LSSAHPDHAETNGTRSTCSKPPPRRRGDIAGLSSIEAAGDEPQKVRHKERPVRGDNRTGQAIWALGVDGRSRRIQLMGRDFRSHIHVSQRRRYPFNASGNFFGCLLRAQAYCAAGRMASSVADLSETIARTSGVSLPSKAFSALEDSGPPAVGTDGPLLAASTAANASASPAPN
jgi:hypothetical protein